MGLIGELSGAESGESTQTTKVLPPRQRAEEDRGLDVQHLGQADENVGSRLGRAQLPAGDPLAAGYAN
ncbi:hypothetical protein N801_04275 [Knoellia aerolata DSM 18566]|uniref:Uncharacterized protein n=1 Tax=Knoellia aerolata DSM 18566 TaxID=1385519 RepID=A0A0A0K0P3_9MICO|nr:hypothetical protein N801_04275 [Knoellia aerolata DSM 18566]